MLVNVKTIRSILQPFGILYGYLVYFMAIWYTLSPFGVFCGHFGIFSHFCMLYLPKSVNPDLYTGSALEPSEVYMYDLGEHKCLFTRTVIFVSRCVGDRH
jgi:hypothetical protein